jgi:hypothetical protein
VKVAEIRTGDLPGSNLERSVFELELSRYEFMSTCGGRSESAAPWICVGNIVKSGLDMFIYAFPGPPSQNE